MMKPRLQKIGIGGMLLAIAFILHPFPFNLLFADPPVTTAVMAIATGTYPALSAGSTGRAFVSSSALGLVSTGTSPGSTIATANSTALNAALAAGDHVVVESGTYWFQTTILVQTGNTIENEGRVYFKAAANSNTTIMANRHQWCVNMSGSTNQTFHNGVILNTETPQVSSTSPVYGDTNIVIKGINFDGNRANQTTSAADSNYPLAYTAAGLNGRVCSDLHLCGVSNSHVDDCTFTGGVQFQVFWGNCSDVTFNRCWFVNTLGSYFPEDDGFHGQGSLIKCGLIDCGSLWTSDNCYTFSAGECLSPSDISLDPYINIGNNYGCFATRFYTNSDGPGFYVVTGASVNTTAQNWNFTSTGMYWDNINPAAYGYGTDMLQSFAGPGNFNFTWRDSFVGTGRNQIFPAGGDGTFVDGYYCPVFQASLSGSCAFGAPYGTMVIDKAYVTGTGSGPIGDFMNKNANSYTASSVTISNSVISGFNDVFANYDTIAGTVTSLGGAGNIFSANDGDVLIAGTYPPTNCLGQFARTLAQDHADAYYQQVYSGTNGVMRAASVTDPVSALFDGLHKLGLYHACLGVVLRGGFPFPTGSSQAAGTYVPTFGGLMNGFTDYPVGGSGGAFAAQWQTNPGFYLTPTPPQLTGSASKSMVVAFQQPSTAYTNWIIGTYDGSDANSAFCYRISSAGYLAAPYMNSSGSQVYVTGTTPIVTGSNYFSAETWSLGASGTNGTMGLYLYGNGATYPEINTQAGSSIYNVRASTGRGIRKRGKPYQLCDDYLVRAVFRCGALLDAGRAA